VRLRIIVLGYIVRCPLGGMAWHHLQYVLGLQRLGHEVFFLEDSDDTPWCCYNPVRNTTDADPEYGLAFTSEAFKTSGAGECWGYHDAHRARWLGPLAPRAQALCASADLLLNLSGANPLRPWCMQIPKRVYVDTDPVFTQIRNLTDPARRTRTSAHTHFLSFGGNLGLPGCAIPSDGFAWRPTRQPVVLDAWPVSPGRERGAFTTVMQWESYAPVEWEGRRYGMKSTSFEPYFRFPRDCPAGLEIALGSPGAPRAQLRRWGWRLRDPLEVTRTPWTYQAYLRDSKGEFSVIKHGYAVANSGWFSERSACYLAGGRPVVVQDSGFTQWMDAGAGVMPFRTPEEAGEAIRRVNADYAAHCREAREVAVAYFDSAKVLADLLEEVGSS
jgi:hypothetical protein